MQGIQDWARRSKQPSKKLCVAPCLQVQGSRRGRPCVCRVVREEFPGAQACSFPPTRHTQGMPLREPYTCKHSATHSFFEGCFDLLAQSRIPCIPDPYPMLMQER